MDKKFIELEVVGSQYSTPNSEGTYRELGTPVRVILSIDSILTIGEDTVNKRSVVSALLGSAVVYYSCSYTYDKMVKILKNCDVNIIPLNYM